MRILGWGLPLGYAQPHHMHAVIAFNPRGSLVTACRGRWSAAEPYVLFPASLFAGDVTESAVRMIGVRVFPPCIACFRAVSPLQVLVPSRRHVAFPAYVASA